MILKRWQTEWQRFLLFLLLVFIPTNLGKHFVFDFSYVLGTLVDYYIPTLYLTDLILLGLFFLYLLELKVDREARKLFRAALKTPATGFLLLFLLVSLPNIDTRNLAVAWYKWLKLFEVCLFAFYLRLKFDFLKNFSFLSLAFSFAVLYESLLAFLQWKNRGTVFGYYFLGESLYGETSLGALYANFFTHRFLRSYGTLPHPNVLGGFLSISLLILLVAFLHSRKIILKGYYLAVVLLGSLGLFFSFSRSAWAAFLIGGVACLIYYFFPKKKGAFVFLTIISLLALVSVYPRLAATLSAIQRYELVRIAGKMFLARPLFGVGLNNFMVRLEEFGAVTSEGRFLQPVHNIYLLCIAELGIFGISAFLALGIKTLRDLLSKVQNLSFYGYLLIIFSQSLLLGLFDHYLLSLQPGLLLFFLILGMALKTS